jgi:hypothetical protein
MIESLVNQCEISRTIHYSDIYFFYLTVSIYLFTAYLTRLSVPQAVQQSHQIVAREMHSARGKISQYFFFVADRLTN